MKHLSAEEKEQLEQLIRGNSEKDVAHVAEMLHQRYHKLVYYFLRIFELPDEDRDDVFNQVFVKVLRGLPNIKHYNNLKSWIVTITKNEIFSHLSKKDRERVVYLPHMDEVQRVDSSSSMTETVESPEREIYSGQIRNAIDNCLTDIDQEFKEPFLMRSRDHMPWRKIAESLGINEDTARKRSDKVRKQVSRLLKLRFGLE